MMTYDEQIVTTTKSSTAETLRRLLAGDADVSMGELLAEDVTWGDCRGAEAVLDFVGSLGGIEADTGPAEVSDHGDRILMSITIGDGSVHLAMFYTDGLITEIVDAPSKDEALSVRAVGSLADAAQRSATLNRAAAVLPVSNISSGLAHYLSLGFAVRAFEGDANYAFAELDGVELHLSQVASLDPSLNTSAVYLYVDDADALYARWHGAGVDGRLVAPTDTDYGLREGAHVDPNGNLLRFGSSTER